jgi:hypothetical protein
MSLSILQKNRLRRAALALVAVDLSNAIPVMPC